MTVSVVKDLNDFCSGHLVVNKERKITFCNTYIDILGSSSTEKKNLINSSLSQCFTKASNIFIDSYVYPLLLVERVVQEIQLSWVDKNQKIIPVVVNIKLDEDGASYWSLYECTNRDKLQTELIKAKEQLEQQSKELYQLAITDPLTGLINRRELQNQASKSINQAMRNSSTLALLCIDVDFFKRVNDSYGHQIGDQVLIKLAAILKSKCRFYDIVSRIGGEEFVLLLPDIDEKNAYQVAETLRTTIETEVINNLHITVSVGLVVSEKNQKVDFDSLLKAADDALYLSKKSGRNRTTIA